MFVFKIAMIMNLMFLILSKIKKPILVSGHVQIAQVPGRNEPDSPGELNYSYLFKTLERYGYQGYIGCEYKPLGEGFWKHLINFGNYL